MTVDRVGAVVLATGIAVGGFFVGLALIIRALDRGLNR